MKKIKTPLLLILSLTFMVASAQENAVKSFTLEEAILFAKENNAKIKNAELDKVIAKQKVWETTTIGLPQVGSKLAYSYMITIPDQITQFSGLSSLGLWMYSVNNYLNQSSGGTWPAPDPATMPETGEPSSEEDLRWGLTYDITVSQLLFSGSYLVGLQTAKIYKQLSEFSIYSFIAYPFLSLSY